MEQHNIVLMLSTEVDRILRSPYPVALKKLHDILQLDIDGDALRLYAGSNPCKCQRLAKEVVDAFETWPYMLDVLQRLSAEATFRKCILEQAPDLLNRLATNAVTNTGSNELCLRLLCEPLPETVPLPASVQKFFVLVVEEAIHSPSASTLWRVYDLLTGACRHLPQMLPCNDRTHLEHELIKILRNAKTIQDQSISLICLGILHALAAPPLALDEEIHQSNGDVDLASDTVRDFFAGKKAFKALTLAALQAAWSCRANNGMLPKKAVSKSLGIVIKIFLTVENSILAEWTKSPEGNSAVSRLLTKIMEDELDPALRLKLLAILGVITKSCLLPPQALEKAESVFLSATSIQTDTLDIIGSMKVLLDSFGNGFGGHVWIGLLRSILMAASEEHQAFDAPKMQLMYMQSRILAANVLQQSTTRKALNSAFAVIKKEPLFQRFLEQRLSPTSCEPGDCCNSTLLEARRLLALQITSLYLSVIHSEDSDRTDYLDGVPSRVLSKFHNVAGNKFSCESATTYSHPRIRVSHVDAGCTPDVPSRSAHWKERLASFVDLDAKYRQDSLVRMVGEICHDLEERCTTTEQPFREEEAKNNQLRQEKSDMSDRNKELQGQVIERDLLLESLEAGKAESDDALRSARSEIEMLLARVEKSERELVATKNAARDEVNRIKADIDSKELELRASLAAKQSSAEELEASLLKSEKFIESLQSEVTSARANMVKLQGNYEALDSSLRDCQEKLRNEGRLKKEAIKDAEGAEADKKRLINELNNLQTKQNDLVVQFDLRRESNNAEIDALKQELEALAASHALASKQSLEKAAQDEVAYTTRINEAITKLGAAEAQVTKLQREVERGESVMYDQQQKVDKLEDLVAEKNEELRDFQAMRQNLAAAIGTRIPERKQATKDIHYTSLSGGSQHSLTPQRRSRRIAAESTDAFMSHSALTPDRKVEAAQVHILDANQSFESVSSRGGPTPKRAKSHKPFKVPSTRQSRLSIAASKSAKAQSKRFPLLDVSAGRGNISPLRPRRSTNNLNKKQDEGEKREVDQFEPIEELEFGSEVFTSTPFTPNPAETRLESEGYDGTTVDE